MIYYTNDNFISFSEKPRKAVSKESFAPTEEPIFTRFIVGDVKNVFFRNNRRRTTSAFADDNKQQFPEKYLQLLCHELLPLLQQPHQMEVTI